MTSPRDPAVAATFDRTWPPEQLASPPLDGCCVAVCTRNRPQAVVTFLQSVRAQTSVPELVLIVDASDDEATEAAVRDLAEAAPLGRRLQYLRVRPAARGLTRQRNLALRLVSQPLIAFFDDDVVLRPPCLERMAAVHHQLGPAVVGVGAYIENERLRPPALWLLRRLTGVVSSLAPGRYCRSGFSTPWGFLPPTTASVAGDWLPGGATMWRTEPARSLGFEHGFAGYGSGEDLDFSLRVGALGRLILAGDARVIHLQADGGRPDGYDAGYRGLANHYHIHLRSLPRRRRRDAVWFGYAFVVDTLLRASGLLRPSRAAWTHGFVRGRTRFLWELMTGRHGTND
jgi:glycosyltransferase involved in cell wall biosynthesis